MKKLFFMMVVLMLASAIPTFAGTSSTTPGSGGIGDYLAIEAHPLGTLNLGGPSDSGDFVNSGIGVVTCNVPAVITCAMTPLTGVGTAHVLPSTIAWLNSGAATEDTLPVEVSSAHTYNITTTRNGLKDPSDTYVTTVTLSIAKK